MELPKIQELSADDVKRAELKLMALLSEEYPDVDFSSGALRYLVVHSWAIISSLINSAVNKLEPGLTVADFLTNPNEATTEQVDTLLQNFLLTRKPGIRARGKVAVILSKNDNVSVPEGSGIIIEGKRYKTEKTVNAKQNAIDVLTENDVLILPYTNNDFVFFLPVIAENVGLAGNVPPGITASLNIPIPNLVTAFVSEAISGGADAETNAAVARRLTNSFAVKAWSNRKAIYALFNDNPVLQKVINLSVVGYGDSVMTRDRRAFWPGSTGGCVDIYVKTRPTWQIVKRSLPATLISKTGSIGRWQINITRAMLPGFYEIRSVKLSSMSEASASFNIISVTRGLSTVADSRFSVVPHFQRLVEGVYSPFQTATVVFDDTFTDASSLPIGTISNNYILEAALMPEIDTIQAELSGPLIRPLFGDFVVKAAIPCVVSVSAEIQVNAPIDTETQNSLKIKIIDEINNLAFSGKLSSATITKSAVDILGSKFVALSNLDLHGSIKRPDGSDKILHNSNLIEIPDEGDTLISPLTVAFMTSKENITLNIVTV